jgi:hypothetical protein
LSFESLAPGLQHYKQYLFHYLQANQERVLAAKAAMVALMDLLERVGKEVDLRASLARALDLLERAGRGHLLLEVLPMETMATTATVIVALMELLVRVEREVDLRASLARALDLLERAGRDHRLLEEAMVTDIPAPMTIMVLVPLESQEKVLPVRLASLERVLPFHLASQAKDLHLVGMPMDMMDIQGGTFEQHSKSFS